MATISVVIPAYNEEANIKATLQALQNNEKINEIIVVNDGSTDKTSELAKAEGIMVLDLFPNRGKGGAMNAVLPLIDTDIVVFLDADLGKSAGEIQKIIQPVIDGNADLCIAAFPPPTQKGGFGIVKGIAAWVIRKVGNIETTAPLSGQRAMTKQVLDTVSPFNVGYGVELGMTIKAFLHGFRVLEVPTVMYHRETGRDLQGFLHRGRQFIDVLRVIKTELRGNGI